MPVRWGLPLGPTHMIELPVNFATDLASSTNEQIANFAPVVLLILGLLLATVAISILIKFLHK